jgi:hypothetical protein
MENEGIMALPGSGAMQGGQGAALPPVTSADSYDAALTALGRVSPQDAAALQNSLGQELSGVQLTPAQLEYLIEIFEFLSQNPRQYKQARASLIEQDAVDPGDLPEEYDAEFLGSVLAALNQLKMSQSQGAQAPMQSAPPVMGPGPMPMAQGGLADMAQYLASKGRNGDTMLAHITPEEASALKRMGGSGTINPDTGLPEFFLKKLFSGVKNAISGVVGAVKKAVQSPVGKVLATVALATVLGPAGVGLSMGTAAGLAGAGTTLLGGGSVKDALIAGAMGYIGGGGTIMGASPLGAVGQYLPGAAGGALNTGLATGVIGAGIGKLGGMSTADALKMGLTSGASAAALQGLQGPRPTAGAPEAAPAQGIPSPGAAAPESGTGTFLSDEYSSYASQKPTGIVDRAIAGAKDIYGEYLSPSRPGLPADAGLFRKYAPLAATGLGVAAASGALANTPSNPAPLYSGNLYEQEARRRMQEREQYLQQQGYGLEREAATAPPQGPTMVGPPMPAYSYIPVGTTPTYTPTGATMMPGGIPQPYNVAGMYGIPSPYASPRPVGMAKGGEMTEFPRKIGAINGPGTGTSDSIPAMLSDGEFVFTAKAVRSAGNGSRRKGAARMYKLMKALEGGPVKV